MKFVADGGMEAAKFESVRHRTRVFALALQAVLAAGAAYTAYRMPQRVVAAEWLVFALDAIVCLALLPVLIRAVERADAEMYAAKKARRQPADPATDAGRPT